MGEIESESGQGNGLASEETAWDPSEIKPEDIKVITRRPRWKKSGSLSRTHHRRVVGDLRQSTGSVGSLVNAHRQHEGTTKRPTETRVEAQDD